MTILDGIVNFNAYVSSDIMSIDGLGFVIGKAFTELDVIVPANSTYVSTITPKYYHSTYVEESLAGAEITAGLSINDFDNVSSGDVNLLDGNLTNLVYNNTSAGTTNKAMPALDLGTPTPISEFHMYGWTNATYIATDYRVEVSNDGVTWTTVIGGIMSNTGLNVIPINGTWRYIRPFIVMGANTAWFTLSEYKVFGVGTTVTTLHNPNNLKINYNGLFLEFQNMTSFPQTLKIFHYVNS